MRDSLHPDRLVVGADDAQAAAMVGELFAATGAPLIVTDATTSETIKYASNAFLATKLSFVNALAGLCEEVGADVRDVMLGLGYDKRIGFEFLRPGPGWGGSCLPKDTRALLHIAERGRVRLLAAGRAPSPANERAAGRVVAKVDAGVRRHRSGGATRGGVGAHLQGQHRRPAGLAEPRRSAIAWRRSGPRCRPSTRRSTADDRAAGGPGRACVLCADPYEAVTGAQVLVVLTEWDEFRWLDFTRVLGAHGAALHRRRPQSARSRRMRRMGFTYTGIGRR